MNERIKVTLTKIDDDKMNIALDSVEELEAYVAGFLDGRYYQKKEVLK